MRYFVIFLAFIFVVAVATNQTSYAQCAYDPNLPHKPCDDVHVTLVIELNETQIENIDGKLFHVIGPFALEQESDDRIRLDGVTFTYPSYPNPPTPGGPVSVMITFEGGAKERIFKIGVPSPFVEFVGVDPQAGVRRNIDGSFDFLLSVKQQFISPLKQIKAGITIDKIQCRESLIPVTRHDSSPACVTYHTGEKLVKRGWATCDDGISHGRAHPCGHHSSGVVDFDSYKEVELVEPELMPLDIASVEDRYVHLNPADMCATVSLRLLSSDDLKQTKSGTKDVVFFDLDDKSMDAFPVLGELIRATHHIESPSNEYAQTEIGLREFVDYEFFIMEKAIAKYNDTQDNYFMKLDGNLDERLADPKKQGFSNEFIAPQIVYYNKTYTMGSTVFWVADEHEMQSISISLQDNLKEGEKYITLTDKDMDSVPKIKQTIERIGTELESIVAFKGMPENPDWDNYREWFDQKKAEQFNLDDVYVKGFVHEGEHYDLGFLIC